MSSTAPAAVDVDHRRRLTTGDANLDLVLGGGFFAGSAVVIAGMPGAGKTILAQQIAVANATSDRPAVLVSTLTEPQPKIVAHLRGFDFFDETTFGDVIRPISSRELVEGGRGIDGLVDELSRMAVTLRPSLVVVDSAKALGDLAPPNEVRRAVYDLVSRLAYTDTTLLLVGEYQGGDLATRPEFAVADAIVELTNERVGAHDRRSLCVAKLRGSRSVDGRHSVRISSAGVRCYPRVESLPIEVDGEPLTDRLRFGVDGIDERIGGGLPLGDATVLTGPSGAGKTVMSLHFAAAGIAAGEPVLFVTLEETPDALTAKARSFGIPIDEARADGRLRLLHAPITELDIDWLADEVRRDLAERNARRVVVDSLGEIVVGAQREGRHPAYVWALTNLVRRSGASALFTRETATFGREQKADLSHLFHNVMALRYLEGRDELSRALMVIKMRDSAHDPGITEFRIGDDGIEMLDRVRDVTGQLGFSSLRR